MKHFVPGANPLLDFILNRMNVQVCSSRNKELDFAVLSALDLVVVMQRRLEML